MAATGPSGAQPSAHLLAAASPDGRSGRHRTTGHDRIRRPGCPGGAVRGATAAADGLGRPPTPATEPGVGCQSARRRVEPAGNVGGRGSAARRPHAFLTAATRGAGAPETSRRCRAGAATVARWAPPLGWASLVVGNAERRAARWGAGYAGVLPRGSPGSPRRVASRSRTPPGLPAERPRSLRPVTPAATG